MFTILILASVKVQAQSGLSYQAVVRNSSGKLIENGQIGMRVSILQGTETGLAVYVEKQSPTSNANGLVTMEIGLGTTETGTFSAINWANGPYYIKTETDLNGGSNYTLVSVNQFLSVPYALYALNSGSSAPGPQGIQGVAGLKGDKGDKGDQGEIGLAGLTGAKGERGEKGEQGIIGLTGPVGATGTKGDPGIQGLKGDKGDQGEIGLTGLTGAKGEKGDKGDKGDQGEIGLTGLSGAKGEKGDKGEQGIIGLTGAVGAKGDQGIQGLKGDKGENGDVVLNNVPNLKVNLAATTAPTVTDDTSKGYAIGSRWINITTMKEYVCVKSDSGTAVWEITTPTQGNLPAGAEGQVLSYKTGNWVASNLTTSIVGSNIPINNLQPYLVMNYQIALNGIFPSRNGSDPFVGEIMLTPYNFAVRDFALCNGQLISVQQNSTLFALLGITYGGNGTTTFGLPDLRGRVPVHLGQNPYSPKTYVLGEIGGQENTTLYSTNLPQHNHAVIPN
ncbi:tail fiber protein [Flavobacterium notoginsengisoli]|uniref:tail fiber protein n=1 Tax=Flavobacterium notoginsengisoli TaxID=1478199 RepID=UPI0036D2AFA0